MSEFRGVDFYRMDDLLSEEERMVRDTVRTFVTGKAAPVMDRHFEAATFPMDLIPEMAGLGLFGANLPEEYGCAGMNNVAYGLVMQELERGDSGLRSFASVQGALVMYPIYAFGSEEQKRRWLPSLAAGEKVGCFGLTEPDHGSDPGGMTTRASRKGDRWVLNGAKSWITNGTIADIAVVWARAEDQVRGVAGHADDRGGAGQFRSPDHVFRDDRVHLLLGRSYYLVALLIFFDKIGDIEKGVLFQTDVDKSRLHPRKDFGYFSFVGIGEYAAASIPFNIKLGQLVVF